VQFTIVNVGRVCVFYLTFPCALPVTSDHEYVATRAVEGANEGWSKSVTQVDKDWRISVCSRHAFFPAVVLFPEDQPSFMMHQRQPPQMTQEVPADGSCFFRLYLSCLNRSLFFIIWHGVLGKYVAVSVKISAISIIVTGALNEAPKLRALCVSKMRQVWEADINTKGPSYKFWELCKRRFKFCGGNPDRHGFISFQEYVDYTGTTHLSAVLLTLKHAFALNISNPFAGVKGTAWAWEPEVTAMAYLLNTTIACFSKTNKNKGDHWQFYRPGPAQPITNPMLLLVNIHQFHFEPVQYYQCP